MSVPILSCPCGLRMKAKGATPGRVGKCPRCGETLVVPEVVAVERKSEGGSVARGYGTTPTYRPAVAKEARPAKKRLPTEPARVLEVTPEVEPWWWPSLLFPLRGAEALMMVGMMGLAFWVVATLVPELCLGFIADATYWGAPFMGYLVALIAALPALALGVFAVAYTLQYLGRVLIAAALGEFHTPRPPDRNFDRITDGLSPWGVWLACGATLGLGPLGSYLLSRADDHPANLAIVAILTAVGLPYTLMAMMRTFLHDGGFPNPFALTGLLIRFGSKFLIVAAVEFGIGLTIVGTFTLIFKLREEWFWPGFLPLMLPCWLMSVWLAIVAMRVLGVFYYHHASALRWIRQKPWWAVN